MTWPSHGPGVNAWHSDAAAFTKLIQDNPDFWQVNMSLKYLQLRIDTRDGGFLLYDRDGKQISPDLVIEAINKRRAA